VQKMNHTVHAEIQVEPPFLCEALPYLYVRKSENSMLFGGRVDVWGGGLLCN
jgi:hypothetical protein